MSLDNKIKTASPHFKPAVDLNALKIRVRQSINMANKGLPFSKRIWHKKRIIMAAIGILALPLSGFTYIHYAYLNGKPVPQDQPPLTQEQQAKILDSLQGITTPMGYFARTNNPGHFRPDQITHNKTDAFNNPNIEEIVLPYGTFVKTSPSEKRSPGR